MLDYILLFLILFGSVVGLIGNTWDEKRKSKIKLTKTGIIAFSIVMVSFVISIIVTYRTKTEAELQAQQRESVRRSAKKELCKTCSDLLGIFGTIYWRISNNAVEISNGGLKVFATDSGIKVMNSLNLLEFIHPQFPQAGIQTISERTTLFRDRMDRLLTRYSSFLKADELLAFEALTSEEALYHMEVSDKHMHTWVSLSKAASNSVTLLTYFKGNKEEAKKFFRLFLKASDYVDVTPVKR